MKDKVPAMQLNSAAALLTISKIKRFLRMNQLHSKDCLPA